MGATDFFWQNVYVAPAEAQIKQKLPEEWQRAAFMQLWDMIDGSGTPSIAAFEASVCQPLKYCQLWLARVQAKYGEIAATNGALQKIKTEMMFSASMRRLVTQAISNKQNLEKAIPDVKIVIDALDLDLQKALSAAQAPSSPKTPEKNREVQDGCVGDGMLQPAADDVIIEDEGTRVAKWETQNA